MKQKYVVGSSIQHRTATLRMSMLALMLVTIMAAALPWSAQPVAAKSARWSQYNTTIDLRQDGSFTVTEDQFIEFDGGPFTQGYAIIPLSRVDNISNVRVLEDGTAYRSGHGDPGTFSASKTGGNIEIYWWFQPAENETRHFTIQYDVTGGLRVYGERDQLWWRAIDADFAGDVDAAIVIVNLPQPVQQDQLAVTWYTTGNLDVTTEIPSTTRIVWRTSGVKQGDAFEVRAEFPKITSAVAPAWQAADDAQRAREERLKPYKALANILMLGVGLLILVGGTAGVILLWYNKGRDAPVTIPIDLLRTPPDDLPAAAVGTLLDEHADDHDVIAGIIALANRGVLQIEEHEPTGILGSLGFGSRDFTFHRLEHRVTLQPFEETLLRAIFGSGNKDEVKLSSIRERFSTHQQQVKNDLYEELKDRGYFEHSPQSIRRAYRIAGSVLLGGAIIAGFTLIGVIAPFAPLVVVPIVATGISGLALILVGTAMPRKTPTGAQAAARWAAFRRYIAEIDRYDNVAEATSIFQQYLPYAIAFGIEHSWVNKFANAGASAPTWYGPIGGWDDPYGRTGRLPRGQRGGSVIVLPGGSSGGGGGLPDLQEMSTSTARSLQGMSDGLFDLFNEASKVFAPVNKGGSGGSGGFSGGGGSFGGGGGGGSRGFS